MLLEKVKTKDLITLYHRTFNMNISSEFKGLDEIGFYHCAESDLKFFYPVVMGSEFFYEKLQEFNWYYLDEKDEFVYASEFIKESDELLEIGAGKGAFRKKVKAKEYIGLEFSWNARDMALKDGIKVLNESIEQHAKNNEGKYDVVCSFQVLEHVNNIRSFIESSIACLKPDGLLICSVPNADSFLSSIRNGILNMPPHHVTWWTDKSLHSIAMIFGLEMVELKCEVLSDVHRNLYSSTVVSNAFNFILGRSPGLIDTSLLGRFINIVTIVLGRFYSMGIINKNVRPHGHTITAVFRKRV